jgi:hypothetical protein
VNPQHRFTEAVQIGDAFCGFGMPWVFHCKPPNKWGMMLSLSSLHSPLTKEFEETIQPRAAGSP